LIGSGHSKMPSVTLTIQHAVTAMRAALAERKLVAMAPDHFHERLQLPECYLKEGWRRAKRPPSIAKVGPYYAPAVLMLSEDRRDELVRRFPCYCHTDLLLGDGWAWFHPFADRFIFAAIDILHDRWNERSLEPLNQTEIEIGHELPPILKPHLRRVHRNPVDERSFRDFINDLDELHFRRALEAA
jgi:hypothetical protein